VSNTLLKADTDVNTDGHQSSKTSGKAHAQNGSDPLRQLFARPWNSSSSGPLPSATRTPITSKAI
jgi:hypothetical protein